MIYFWPNWQKLQNQNFSFKIPILIQLYAENVLLSIFEFLKPKEVKQDKCTIDPGQLNL